MTCFVNWKKKSACVTVLSYIISGNISEYDLIDCFYFVSVTAIIIEFSKKPGKWGRSQLCIDYIFTLNANNQKKRDMYSPRHPKVSCS